MLTPAVLDYLLSEKGVYMDGIIGPGHVTAVIGAKAYEEIARKFNLPIVISGFEPLDLILGIHLLIEKILQGEKGVFIAYERAVSYEGNLKAKELINRVFEVRKTFPWRVPWRGPFSGFAIRLTC